MKDEKGDRIGSWPEPQRQAWSRLLAAIPESRRLRILSHREVRVPPQSRLRDQEVRWPTLRFLIAGESLHRINGREIALKRGSLVYLGAGNRLEGIADRRDPPHAVAIGFKLEDARTGRSVADPALDTWFAFRAPNHAMYRALFTDLILQARRSAEPWQGLADSLLHYLLGRILGDADNDQAPPDSRILRVADWIDAHPRVRSSTAQLARLAGLSPRYFVRLFHETTGLSPKAYEIRSRCRHGGSILEETDRSVKEVAYDLGYADPRSFSRQFRREMGHLPGRAGRSKA